MTCSGWPVKRLRSTGSWVATPTGQVLRWHLRIMMQPAAISGAVEKPNSSAPSSAPITTSRPVRMPPSTCTAMRLRSRLATSVWWVSARPISHGEPACLSEVSGERAGAALEARDGDMIGARLRDAGGDGADADLGDELHRDVARRIDVLQVEDELRQILDRIDVVMRRRRDQADARRRVAHLGDGLVDLVAGQLAAFAGLGALRHLDLHHVRVDEILGGDAEAARGDLLDRRAHAVAVRQRLEAVGSPRRPRRCSTCRRSGSWRWRAWCAPRARSSRTTSRRSRSAARWSWPARPRRSAPACGRPPPRS